MISIKFKKLTEETKLPSQAKPGDAAFDLSTLEEFTLFPGETKVVSTGLVLADVQCSEGGNVFLQVVGRSGLAVKGIFPLGGIVDASYRGEIKVILHNGNPKNWSREIKEEIQYASAYSKVGPGVHRAIPDPNFSITYKFEKGDRIAQMLVQRIATGTELSISEATEITTTERGGGGFGSTGR